MINEGKYFSTSNMGKDLYFLSLISQISEEVQWLVYLVEEVLKDKVSENLPTNWRNKVSTIKLSWE